MKDGERDNQKQTSATQFRQRQMACTFVKRLNLTFRNKDYYPLINLVPSYIAAKERTLSR